MTQFTYYRWRKQFGGLTGDQVKRLKELEKENDRLRKALRIDRSTVRYTSTRPDDAPLREAMKALAAERRRFGYRRIHVMLDRQGIVMNQKKLRRLYREEKLQVRRRGGRKRALGARRPMLVPDRANARWSQRHHLMEGGLQPSPTTLGLGDASSQ